MKKHYYCHTDSGHGWLAVKRQELIDFGILNKITHFSYQKGDTVYLEEDCDASIFMEEYLKRSRGVKPEFIDSYHDVSPVRNYPSFSLTNS